MEKRQGISSNTSRNKYQKKAISALPDTQVLLNADPHFFLFSLHENIPYFLMYFDNLHMHLMSVTFSNICQNQKRDKDLDSFTTKIFLTVYRFMNKKQFLRRKKWCGIKEENIDQSCVLSA